MLHRAVAELEQAPGLTKEETQWLREFDRHLTDEFAVVKQMEKPLPKRASA